MIHFSQLGGYAKISPDENKDIKYYFKLIDHDIYEVSYLYGKHVMEKNILDKENAINLINSCISEGFEKLTKLDLDNHNKNKWAELTLVHYDKILPDINNKTVKVKM